jgi:hypothetical protein
MQMNVFIDFVIGLLPLVGDVADVFYKCNTRNAILLENELRNRSQERTATRRHGLHLNPLTNSHGGPAKCAFHDAPLPSTNVERLRHFSPCRSKAEWLGRMEGIDLELPVLLHHADN